MPTVSIITPCYNSGEYIAETVESVQAQTLLSWEQIVVDDGSTDESPSVVQGYLNEEPRLRLITVTNGGCASARNLGFKASSPQSRYLLFLDADDRLDPQMLSRMCQYLDEHEHAGLVYCGYHVINSESEMVPTEMSDMLPRPRLAPHWLGIRALRPQEVRTPLACIFSLTAGIIPSLALFRRSVYEMTPGWDESMGIIYEDVGLYLHVALRSEVHYLQQPLVHYRRHPEQSTAPERGREREATQRAKLYAKWEHMSGLTLGQQDQLDDAHAFQNGRIVPLSGLMTAMKALRQGHWRDALRFGGGALRRYAASFLTRLSFYVW